MLPFEVINSVQDMRVRSAHCQRNGWRLCLVPTMGALHEGHVSLIREGRRRSDMLVVSIFVNPTQFGEGEDLESYPRSEESDAEAARSAGANIVFCPTAAEIYPDGYQTRIDVPSLSSGLCGDSRPGHFSGVATVVAKLFNIVRPHVAIFGEKDFQQLTIIERMNRDLDFNIDIVRAPIVRDVNGLALSSRNQYLSTTERQSALSLNRALRAAFVSFAGGEREPSTLLKIVRAALDDNSDIALEYIELRNASTLERISTHLKERAVVALAARVGSTRLIDNIILG